MYNTNHYTGNAIVDVMLSCHHDETTKEYNIGVGRFRKLGVGVGQGLEYWGGGGQGGAKFPAGP